ncbi:MAG: hypothetical protein HZA60_11035 [Deltaproteobacteria bacterium]|nr:hypothetical protein [Deltaproteobacteria bacterium]
MRAKAALLVVFAAGMAYVEAAVVIYLRALIGAGPLFPMKDLPPPLLFVEVAREAATLVILVSVSCLAVRGGARRMGAFLLTFAVWDIFYYLWLHVATGWPAGVSDWDILFLIPLPWVGPVWSVLLLCAGMIGFSVFFLRTPEDAPFSPGLPGWATGAAGVVAVVATYILEWKKIGYGKGVPSGFSLLPFLLGVLLLAASGWITYRRALAASR